MVREVAIHLEEQLGDFDVELLENAMNHGSGRTVSRVGDYFDAPIQAELSRHFVHVGRDGVAGTQGSPTGFEIAALDNVANFLNGFAMQRARAADAFEAVVLGRIVASRDHNGAMGVQVLRGVIKDRSGDCADIGDVAANGEQTLHQRVAEPR